ncbi:MAG: hypothetical protein LBE11_00110 [Prevotellaceae bacterium]|jgi:predicted RNase H-like nuclease (RuvC/YqgF family)|nr:hypothetical protein [Prevotellaceae bacterium]
MKRDENLIKKALELLKQSEITAYKIAKSTNIHETSITNYRKGITTPTRANATALINYFDSCKKDNKENVNLIDKIEQQAEIIGTLKNENKNLNEKITVLQSELERIKKENAGLRNKLHSVDTNNVFELPKTTEIHEALVQLIKEQTKLKNKRNV